MKQLNSIEHMFFDMEAGELSLDVSSLHFYNPATAPRGKVTFQQVFNRFLAGLDKAPVFKRKLVTVPMGIDHPYWVMDPDFDLANHLEHIELPAPGSWEQLMDVVSELKSRDIDNSKPVWFGAIITGVNAVEGLPANTFAMFMKMHHSAIDGASGRAIQEAIHDLEPKAVRKPRAKKDEGKREKLPTSLQLLTRAYANNIVKSYKTTRTVMELVPGLVANAGKSLLDREAEAEEVPEEEQMGKLQPTALNPEYPGDSLRVDGRLFSLKDVKSMRKLVEGATLNDVVFAIIAGGIRRYLDAVDYVPDWPLTCGMPIDVRSDDTEDATVMVNVAMSQLYTNIEDPIERLVTSSLKNREGKESGRGEGAMNAMSVLSDAPFWLTSPLLKGLAKVAGMSSMVGAHTLITNVPGIPVPIYLAGAQMVAMMGMAPAVARTGAIHGVFSTVDTLTISLTCGNEVVEDTGFYMDCMQASFDEYLQLVKRT